MKAHKERWVTDCFCLCFGCKSKFKNLNIQLSKLQTLVFLEHKNTYFGRLSFIVWTDLNYRVVYDRGVYDFLYVEFYRLDGP